MELLTISCFTDPIAICGYTGEYDVTFVPFNSGVEMGDCDVRDVASVAGSDVDRVRWKGSSSKMALLVEGATDAVSTDVIVGDDDVYME